MNIATQLKNSLSSMTPKANAADKGVATVTKFPGTRDPGQLRLLDALLSSSLGLKREEVDNIAGTTDGHDIVHGLRNLGLEIPCEFVQREYRDGEACHSGRYVL